MENCFLVPPYARQIGWGGLVDFTVVVMMTRLLWPDDEVVSEQYLVLS